jgi:plastocyanin
MALIGKNINITLNNHGFLMTYNVILSLLLLCFFSSSVTSSYEVNQKFIITIPQGAGTDTVQHFMPNLSNIHVRDTVEWINDDSTIHTVNSVEVLDNVPNINSNYSKKISIPSSLFDSNILFPGDKFDYTFEREGVYSYICAIHLYIIWTINVEINSNNEMST